MGHPDKAVQAGLLNLTHLGPENMNPNKSQQQDPQCIPTWLPKLRALPKMAEPKCLQTSQGQRLQVFLEGHWESGEISRDQNGDPFLVLGNPIMEKRKPKKQKQSKFEGL